MHEIAFFYPEGHAAHARAGHPERPERVEAIRAALEEAGLWQLGAGIGHEWDANMRVAQMDAQMQTALETVHTAAYLSRLERASAIAGSSSAGEWGGQLDSDTYLTGASWKLARQAVAGACNVARAVWQRQARRGFALTRPPGHHALPGQGMGFCLLNNIAVAAQDLIWHYGAQRLAIVDLDLHHGNGTQEVFWRRPEVLFISTHQVPLYPGSGSVDETGAGPGAGCTVNLPLPPGAGDQAFQAMMSKLILPLLGRFAPEMLLVSFGFDPHWRDPLGSLQLSVAGYAGLIAELASFSDQCCDGRIALFLEGGYDLDAGRACSVAATQALLGRVYDDPLGPCPLPEGAKWPVFVQAAREVWGM